MKKNYFLKEATTSSLNSKTGFFGFKDNYLSTINFWQIVAILLVLLVSGSVNAQTSCGTSIPITINGACLNGSVNDATQDLPNIGTCVGAFKRERWYTFTVSGGPLAVTITAISADRNLYLQLISSTSACAGLAQIACANSNSTNNSAQTETITETLSNGIYYLKVLNVGGQNSNLNLSSLCITAPAPNDICATATTIVSNTTCVTTSGSTLGATNNNETGDCTNGTEKAVWYNFTAIASTHTVTVDGIAGFDAVIGANTNCGSTIRPTGGGCTDTSGNGGDETMTLTGLTIGNTYYIQVYEFNGDTTEDGFTICITHVLPCATPTAQPTSLTFGAITTTSIAGSFLAASPAPNKYLVVRSTSATAPSPGPINGTAYALNAVINGATVLSNTNSLSFSTTGLTLGTQYYFYIYSFNDTSCIGGPTYLTTSPLSGSQATTCGAGTGVGSNTITTNSANITWASSGNYVVEYGLFGFVPGNGTSPGVGGTIASISTTSPFALTGLSSFTNYSVYIRQVCPLGGLYSANSAVHSFTTVCTNPVITAQPTTPVAVCAGAGTTSISVSIIGSATYQWRRNGTNLTNVAPYSTVNTATLTITNPAILQNGTTYDVVITRGACSTTSTPVTLTVNASPVITGQPSLMSAICAGTGSTSQTVTATGVVTYQWRKNGVNLTNAAPYSNVTTATLNITNPAISENGAVITVAVTNAAGCTTISIPRTLTVNAVPSASITPSPANVATGVCYSGTGAISSISWAATAGATSYDIYFGAGSLPTTVIANVATNLYTISTLLPNTTYYWKVVAKNSCGAAIGSATWRFTTANTPCYCTSTAMPATSFAYFTAFSTTGGSTNITNNASGYSANGYGNFTSPQAVTQTLNGVVNYSTTIFGITELAGVAIFVDWNQNGVFTDAGENVYNSAGYISVSPSGSFSVPTNAAIGTTRMRIVINYYSGTPVSCNAGIDGETEDYSFVVSAPSCYVPPIAATTNINNYTATINWMAPTVVPSNGYQYVVSTSNIAPVGAGTPNLALTANVTGLSPSTTYYVFVRSNCGGSDFSYWSVAGIFTTPCLAGSGIGTTTLECPSVLTGGLGLNGIDIAPIECNALSTCVDLEATYQAIAQTTSYTVSSIPYAPPYQFGCLTNPVSVNIDDIWSPVINLPFDFCFYGNSYNSCIIGSNGLLSFNTGAASGPSGFAFNNNLPSTIGDLFANTIYGVYHDIDPSKGGQVGWELITLNTGCRAMVASWKDVPMYSNNSILYTGMMVLYENTNVIDVYIKEKNIDNNNIFPWNGGNAIVGIQNATATQAVVAPGKNGLDTNWSATTQAWRFSPSGAPVSTIEWFEGAGTSGTLLGTTAVLNVCPTETTTYTAKVTYALCGGRTLIETDETTVTVAKNMVWNGSVSSNWNTANNWTPAIIPTLLDCVTVPVTSNNPIISGTSYNAISGAVSVLNGASLTVNSSNTLTVTKMVNVAPSANLFVKNTASLIQINNASINTGNITMERTTNMRKADYVYWSSPVDNFSSSAISPGTPTSVIWKWNPTIANTNNGQGAWVNGNETMLVGKGYIVRGPSNFTTAVAPLTATFNGVPYNGIKQPAITRGTFTSASYAGTNGVMITNTDDNWNLVGNPYPSAIDAISFLAANTNIDGNVRLWTHGTPLSAANTDPFYADYQYNFSVSDYVNFNGLGSTPPGFGGKIGAGQGFFVFMNDGPATTENVTFNNSMRSNTYSNSQFFRTNNDDVTPQTQTEPEKHRIWLSLLNSSNVPVTTLVGYATDATFERDRMFDAPHKVGTAMGIYSLIGEKTMIIQGRPVPFDNQDMVPLGVTIPSTGTYKIAISVVEGLFDTNEQNIYLEDTTLGIIHDIRVAPYSFTATAGDYKTRFILRYTNQALGNETMNENQTFAYVSDNTLQIQSSENILEVTVFDVTGKLVKTCKSANYSNILESDFNFATGVYLTRIKLENGTIVGKKLMN